MKITCLGSHKLPVPWCAAWLVLLAIGASGCGKSTATVKGKVTLDDKPVPNATVTFYGGPNDSVVAGDKTKEDGTYAVLNAPIGAVKITVKTIPPPGEGTGFALADPTKDMAPKDKVAMRLPSTETGNKEDNYVPIDRKYADIKTSGLGREIKSGTNTFDIPLK